MGPLGEVRLEVRAAVVVVRLMGRVVVVKEVELDGEPVLVRVEVVARALNGLVDVMEQMVGAAGAVSGEKVVRVILKVEAVARVLNGGRGKLGSTTSVTKLQG